MHLLQLISTVHYKNTRSPPCPAHTRKQNGSLVIGDFRKCWKTRLSRDSATSSSVVAADTQCELSIVLLEHGSMTVCCLREILSFRHICVNDVYTCSQRRRTAIDCSGRVCSASHGPRHTCKRHAGSSTTGPHPARRSSSVVKTPCVKIAQRNPNLSHRFFMLLVPQKAA